MPLWLYSLPTWIFATFVVSCYQAFNLIGYKLTIFWHEHNVSKNRILNLHFATIVATTVTAFFALTLTLISISTWESYTGINTNLSSEVSSTSVFYRTISLYPSPIADILQQNAISYVEAIIKEEWPQQQKGIVPNLAFDALDRLQEQLYLFEPKGESQTSVHQVALNAFADMLKYRRARVQTVTDSLPSILWLIVYCGSSATLASHWPVTIHPEKPNNRISYNVEGLMIVAFIISITVFLMGAFDHPYFGDISIDSKKYQLLLDRMLATVK
jgi:hypothetical protein